MDNTNLPYWFKVEEITPINFYRYTSFVESVFISFSSHNDVEREKYAYQISIFNKLREKIEAMKIVSNGEITDVRWDNKVVIECINKDGHKFFVGYKDWTYSIGLGRRGDEWVKPQQLLSKEDAADPVKSAYAIRYSEIYSDKYERQYIRSDKAWYAEANQIFLPELTMGIYHEDGGCLAEMIVKWHSLNGKLSPRLESFDDSWLLLTAFDDLIKLMSENDSRDITPEVFTQLLDSLGFKDDTPYTSTSK